MRTESANCGGGGAVESQHVVLINKSQQDVEAAFAIAQLSEQQPRETNCQVRTTTYKADSCLTNGCNSASPSPPRISHLRAAVMPHTCSRVERAAVKRKLELRDERAAANLYKYKQPRLEDAIDPVQRAISSERDTFMTARRHNHIPSTVDAAGESELVGRFVRTCRPGGRNDDAMRQLYVTVSDHTTSPTLVSALPSLFPASSSSQCDVTVADHTPMITERLYAPPSLSTRRRPRCHDDSSDLWDNVHKRRVLPQARHIPPPFASASYKKSHGREAFRSSLASAYYSLGQTAAAAAASQFFTKPLLSHSVVPLTAKSQPRARNVDSCTMQKVRRGEFGSLSTLRQYCIQLRRHSEPGSSSADVVKQSSDEVAVDLSMRKHSDVTDTEGPASYRASRSCGSSPSTRHDEVYARRWTTGQLAEHSTLAKLRTSSISLPSSPYTSRHDGNHHGGLVRHHEQDTSAIAAAPADSDSDADAEKTSSDVTEERDVVADSRLPLKKRRLHYHSQQQQPTLAAISEDDCDKPWTSENTVHEDLSSSASDAAAVNCEVSGRDVGPLECSQSVFLHPDDDGDLPLHIAVAKGTAAAVDSIISVMLSLGVGLDYCNNRHQTALHLAVLTDQADIVRRLLDGGASSDVVDSRGQTCLHVAVLLDTTRCLRQLLKHSRCPPHINALSYDGVTALHLAAQRGNINAVRCLLSAGADVDVVDTRYGRTALYYAVDRNHITTAELLLSYGANPAQVTYSGSTTPSVPAGYISKCSTAMLQLQQPAYTYRQLPTCCPTG